MLGFFKNKNSTSSADAPPSAVLADDKEKDMAIGKTKDLVVATGLVYEVLISAIIGKDIVKINEVFDGAQIDPCYIDSKGIPLINHGILTNEIKVVECLLLRGVSVNVCDRKGTPSLILAVQCGVITHGYCEVASQCRL